jgi:predicted membrane chloride channel (bestrophin family)
MNLMLKREFLSAENKRLLEKNKKVNTIIETLIAQGADMAEINDVKAMMSKDDLSMLNSVTEHCDKIEHAEIQLIETIFLFETYFYYNTVTPVLTSSKK